MKCPKCKEIFDLQFYESHGRCSECGYSLAEDINIVNAILRDSKKKTSKYSKMESVSSSTNDNNIEKKVSKKATVSVKSGKERQSAADKQATPAKIKKPVSIPSVPRTNKTENQGKNSATVATKNIPKKKSVDTSIDEKPKVPVHKKTITQEETKNVQDFLEEPDNLDSFDFEDDEPDISSIDVVNNSSPQISEETVDDALRTISKSLNEQGNPFSQKRDHRRSDNDKKADPENDTDTDQDYSSIDLKALIRKKLKSKLKEQFPLITKINNVVSGQGKSNRDKPNKKKKSQQKNTLVKETETEFNSNVDGYYNDITYQNEPTADKIPISSIGRVIFVLIFLWLLASFLIYYA